MNKLNIDKLEADRLKRCSRLLTRGRRKFCIKNYRRKLSLGCFDSMTKLLIINSGPNRDGRQAVVGDVAAGSPAGATGVSPPSNLNDPDGPDLAAAQDNHPARRRAA